MGSYLLSPLAHGIVQRVAARQECRENQPENTPHHGKNDNKMGTGPKAGPSSSFLLSGVQCSTAEVFIPLMTSFAKKNLPSLGTIMICTLSESFSAMIFCNRIGLSFRTPASSRSLSESALDITT